MAEPRPSQADLLVIGSCVLDISCTYQPAAQSTTSDQPVHGSSNPAKIAPCVGGVAHNMALAAHYAGASVKLCTVVADDDVGDLLLRKLEKEGLSTNGIFRLPSSSDVQTGMYVGNYDASKSLLFGMADVSLMKHSSLEDSKRWTSLVSETAPKWILLDTCFPSSISSTIIQCARKVQAQVFVEAVSVPRAGSIMQWVDAPSQLYPHCVIDVVSLNHLELNALHDSASSGQYFDSAEYTTIIKQLKSSNRSRILRSSGQEEVSETADKAFSLLPYFPVILTTLDEKGCVLAMLIVRGDNRLTTAAYKPYLIPGEDSAPATVFIKHFPPQAVIPQDKVVSVNGAGDVFKGALLARMVSSATGNDDEATMEDEICIQFAQAAAACSVKHEDAVSPEIKKLATGQ